MTDNEDLAICTNCGTQFDASVEHPPETCRLCNDPRHFVPERGQTWTSFRQMRGKYQNRIIQDKIESRVWTITTEPRFAIGERCFLIPTPQGNVLWDVMAYLDNETIDFIRGKGGLEAIVISHPHFYTTHLHWARVFDCPVYTAAEDETWLQGKDVEGRRRLMVGQKEEIVPGVTAIKTGGHFPGSLVLLWEKHLFIADTLFTVPSSRYPVDRHPGTTSYAFMWSIPNMIPLPPSELAKIWNVLKELDFESTHGGFAGMDVHDKNMKARILESMKIQVRAVGYEDHEILRQTWP